MKLTRRQPYTRRRPTTGQDRPAVLEVLEPRTLLSGSVSAEFVWVDNTAALTGFKTADLQVTTDTDWTGAALLLN